MTMGKRFSTAIYNPHLLDREALVATFVARRPLLEEILDDLRRGAGQHHLLLGARGAGKTTLLLRIAYGIEDDPKLARTCIPLRFPEEQYNVSQPADFWMNCIDALTDALEQRGNHEAATKLDHEVKTLEQLGDEPRAHQSLALLTSWAKRNKKNLVLLVDNLDIVLQRLSEAHWSLREALSADNRLAVIGASATSLQESLVYESPFYDFFHLHELGRLTEEEARQLVVELARQSGAPEVEELVAKDPGRFKALYVLTGGMPRTLALLHGILATGKSARVEEDLEGLIDQLTPYYKARFDDLPTQSQLIVDAVALHWHPLTAATCATNTRIAINVVSAQLDRLTKQGLLTKVALGGVTKLGFMLAERFFNIWYLMRASRRLRRRLGWLVEFLRVFYGEADLQKRAEEILATPAGRKSLETLNQSWPIARQRMLLLFKSVNPNHWDELQSTLPSFFRASVQHGFASQAVELLKEAGVEDRLIPLYEALRAAAAGPGATLSHLAPEIRVPAEELLTYLLQPESPSAVIAKKEKPPQPPKVKKPRHAKPH